MPTFFSPGRHEIGGTLCLFNCNIFMLLGGNPPLARFITALKSIYINRKSPYYRGCGAFVRRWRLFLQQTRVAACALTRTPCVIVWRSSESWLGRVNSLRSTVSYRSALVGDGSW